MKTFIAAGDVLINPSLLAYVNVETDSDGTQLRLGFAGQSGGVPAEVRLEGLEARSVLRWLRSNSEFLDSGRPPFHQPRVVTEINTYADPKPPSTGRRRELGVVAIP